MIDVRNLYRENAACGASPVRQVVMLYEQMVEDLRRAQRAMAANQIEDRTQAINHALLVLGHLQSKLNMEAGGKVALALRNFYNVLRQKLVEAQFGSGADILDEQITLLLDLRDAWVQVDRAETNQAAQTPGPATTVPDTTPPLKPQNWRG